jgi:hypothetical protein
MRRLQTTKPAACSDYPGVLAGTAEPGCEALFRSARACNATGRQWPLSNLRPPVSSRMHGAQVVDLARMVEVVLDHGHDDDPVVPVKAWV